MDAQDRWRQVFFVMALATVPVLGLIGWWLSPGREAFWGPLSYFPLLVLSSFVSMFVTAWFFCKKSIPSKFILVPGALIGSTVFAVFLAIDHRETIAECNSDTGLRGIIYSDSSGEFGVTFFFTVERRNGDLVGKVMLGSAMSADESHFSLREINGQIQAIDNRPPAGAVAWYSPASDQIVSFDLVHDDYGNRR